MPRRSERCCFGSALGLREKQVANRPLCADGTCCLIVSGEIEWLHKQAFLLCTVGFPVSLTPIPSWLHLCAYPAPPRGEVPATFVAAYRLGTAYQSVQGMLCTSYTTIGFSAVGFWSSRYAGTFPRAAIFTNLNASVVPNRVLARLDRLYTRYSRRSIPHPEGRSYQTSGLTPS